jgi:hypothetical protein
MKKYLPYTGFIIAILTGCTMVAWGQTRIEQKRDTPQQIQAEALQSIARDMGVIRRELEKARRCQCKK